MGALPGAGVVAGTMVTKPLYKKFLDALAYNHQFFRLEITSGTYLGTALRGLGQQTCATA